MCKRSGLFFAILLILSIAQVKMPVAAAQSAGSDTLDCPSGVISSVDGSCVSEDDTLGPVSYTHLSVLGIGYVLPMLYMPWSLKYGKIAGSNPWQATGLEWQIQSPPLTENFVDIPIMDHEAYDYDWLAHKTEHEVTTVG